MHERIELNPGLALIRYASDRPSDYNAVIEVEIPAGVSAVFDPTCRGPVLERPGQCAVIRCDQSTEIRLWPRTSRAGEQVRGSVTVEYLTKGVAASQPVMAGLGGADMNRFSQSAQAETRPAGQGIEGRFASDGLRLIGHLAYKGDTVATGGQWLGGPEAPARIEGVTVNWPQCPNGVELLLCDPATGQTCRTGEFLGTKGRSKTLRGLELWLEGRVPDGLTLSAEAVFERAGTVRKQGKWIALMGTDASDELIGLKLEVDSGERFSEQFEPDFVGAEGGRGGVQASEIVQSMGENASAQRQRTRLFRKRDF